jgi:hypothetical protein
MKLVLKLKKVIVCGDSECIILYRILMYASYGASRKRSSRR